MLSNKNFEDSQFENNRADEWRKLKPKAVPTVFNLPSPPTLMTSLPRNSTVKSDVRTLRVLEKNEHLNNQFQYLTTILAPVLEEENQNLKTQSASVNIALIDPISRENTNLREEIKK
ncbi:hypothetical protein ABEB36_000271 [Hypothenemus hampei]|uniref:Uncharacterized protein n=1 Tax=Hypothenemus hampei TaxID=57062 RepID=A0ABD1FAR2_HYPHA